MSIAEKHVQSLSDRLRLKVYDITDQNASRNWSSHHRQVLEHAQSSAMSIGDLFIVIARHPRGYWASEWSVVGTRAEPRVTERRCTYKKDLDEAVQAMLSLASYARPARKGLLKRKTA